MNAFSGGKYPLAEFFHVLGRLIQHKIRKALGGFHTDTGKLSELFSGGNER